MINWTYHRLHVLLTNEIVNIQFTPVPAVVIHVVHCFCAESNGHASPSGGSRPGRHTLRERRWAFIFRRVEWIRPGIPVYRQPPVGREQGIRLQIAVHPARTRVDHRGTTGAFPQDPEGFHRALRDAVDASGCDAAPGPAPGAPGRSSRHPGCGRSYPSVRWLTRPGRARDRQVEYGLFVWPPGSSKRTRGPGSPRRCRLAWR